MPIFIRMSCIFCKKAMEYQPESVATKTFDLYLCRNCQRPQYKTLYRQLYNHKKVELLSDNIQIDNYFITRYFQPTHKDSKYNYSVLYKDVIGVLESNPNMEPISLKREVGEVDHIIELPWDDLEAVKRKLKVYTTFS
jgi:hypothetical protein